MKTDVMEHESKATTPAQNKPGSSKQDGKEEMMKKMEAAGAPGPAHQALAALAGDWKAEVKCWMDPNAAPQVTQATAKAKMTFKGRFLEEEFQGEMMGKPFTGRTIMGFDNTKQAFRSLWISDTQTSMFTSEGKGDNGNKVITLEGEASCPMSGLVKMKTILRQVSPDKRTLEMFGGSQGNNAKTMEITYTRQ